MPKSSTAHMHRYVSVNGLRAERRHEVSVECIVECPACFHRVANRIGPVGDKIWYQCRACGMDFYEKEVENAHSESEAEDGEGAHC